MEAKQALDRLIRKSRVHFYKPIQIAEVLFRHRTRGDVDLADLESYRNPSKRWRDRISLRLIGRVSTSSQKFQDNIFESNAIPPDILVELGTINKKHDGAVEGYIYHSLRRKLSGVAAVREYVRQASTNTFSLADLESMFTASPGLRRSVDKMYEIVVYALFDTLIRALRVEVTLRIGTADRKILDDFAPFLRAVLGVDPTENERTFPAALHRVGVTNAADRGLDIWANFGPAVQVKHLTLTPELVEDIAGQITADRIVVVCRDAEKKSLDSVLTQVGMSNRIQGIITFTDLERWYDLSLSPQYRKTLGKHLLKDLEREFSAEFPACEEMTPFLEERGYDKIPHSPWPDGEQG